ncbi:MAG: response regulator [gamma proteobacterium symbiont of Bathyaustriella thionipta]|nr:response regulator [gamma proteobacterium symbiont of Bathyaustriella thionipta]MCU7948811.1 response regulator [gamma proteobacterium symbiont of Bathyaustriella thionipta]MCU7954223.1 response regulator [gamma proteobacterium symbiont of Bathyaustriella thionipta]MCU7955269.1 response regulator [gamma proteobacterium symbiont of Bathyaustriella thionipta]MCU7966278.1 response regulator [gamma proteobacterium symbiont of Bathyaustriella thionipta]
MSRLDLSKTHFLIIDDFGNYRSMLRSILVSCGAQHIDDAANAKDALKKVIHNKFDVILCDYNLGEGQNGQQLLEEIMHRHLIPYGTIYIMITAENTQSMVMAAVEYRPDGYLNKPFPKDLLLKRLNMLVEKKSIMKDIYTAYNKQDYITALKIADEKMAKYCKQALDIGKLKAEIALKANQLDIAQQVYDQALSVRDFQWAKVGKAKVLIKRKDDAQAQVLLEEVIEENKNYIEAYDLLAEILERQGKSKQVQTVLSQATKISPNTIARQQHLAQVAIENDDFSTAEKSLKKAVSHGKHSCFGKIGDNMNLVKLYADNGKGKQAIQTITAARKIYKKDKEAQLHTQFVESMTHHKLGNEDKARDIFQQAISNISGHLSDLPAELQNDLIATTHHLGETELAEALIDDINNPSEDKHTNTEEMTRKYHYLLQNGKGMRLYNANHIFESIKVFEDAAQHLPDRISVNMNAAQALLIYLKSTGVDAELLDKARHYLDISQKLDKHNEKYQKLEAIYSGLK